MISKWTQHLTNPEDKAKFEQEIKGSKRVLDRLLEITKEQENSMDAQEISPKNYDSPCWSHKQAHKNGFRQCLAGLKTLLDLKETNDPK